MNSFHTQRPLPLALAILPILFLSSLTHADVQIRYPFGGYFHPGRYMPVRVVADVPEIADLKDQRVYLSIPGAMETEVVLGGGKVNAVVPWLPLEEVEGPMLLKIMAKGYDGRQQEDSQRLRALGPNQRLVAYATGDAESASAAAARAAEVDSLPPSSPGQWADRTNWVPIELDRSHPLDGPPAAWEGLDAVVLDSAALTSGQIDEQKLGVLVAAGTAVLVRDANPIPGRGGLVAKPPFDSHWPWRRIIVPGDRTAAEPEAGATTRRAISATAGYWLLHQAPAGPALLTFSDQVFRPVAGKDNGWPVAFRRHIVLYGALFSVTLLALVLWRPKGVTLWGLILSAGTVGVLVAWWRLQTPLVGRGGPVLVIEGGAAGNPEGKSEGPFDGGLIQTDGWSFQSTATSAASTIHWADVTKPVFARRQDLATGSVVLRCGPSGDPHEFFVRLPAGGRLALWTRAVGPGALKRDPQMPVTSELMPLVKEIYLGPGDEVLGQIPWTPPVGSAWQEPESWQAVVIRRGKSR